MKYLDGFSALLLVPVVEVESHDRDLKAYKTGFTNTLLCMLDLNNLQAEGQKKSNNNK